MAKRRKKITWKLARADSKDWGKFAQFHYLHSVAKFTDCYAVVVDGRQAAFIGMSASSHAGIRRVGRLAVLPQYDGYGIGLQLLNAVSGHVRQTFEQVTFSTESSTMGGLLAASSFWEPTSHHLQKGSIKDGKRVTEGIKHVYRYIGPVNGDALHKSFVTLPYGSLFGDSCIKHPGGRPRKYASNAERQRAYRLRNG